MPTSTCCSDDISEAELKVFEETFTKSYQDFFYGTPTVHSSSAKTRRIPDV